MSELGALRKLSDLPTELEDLPVLVSAKSNEEHLLRHGKAERMATQVFAHETIQMMMAERTAEMDQLKLVVDDHSIVLPIVKKPESI